MFAVGAGAPLEAGRGEQGGIVDIEDDGDRLHGERLGEGGERDPLDGWGLRRNTEGEKGYQEKASMHK